MTEAVKAHETSTSMVSAVAAELDAGTDIALKVRVLCPSSCNLQGGKVRIVDDEGVVAKDVDLASFDGTANETGEFAVKAPIKPGAYTWTALFPTYEKEGVQHDQSSAPFSFTVKPHLIDMSVWGMPSPVIKGEHFTVKIGAKCVVGCSLAGLPYAIHDDRNKQVAADKLGEMALPQTSGLYWSEQELNAPSEEGLYKWVAECIASDMDLPHQVNPNSFTFSTSRPPEHIATVEVIEIEKRTPLENASVFMNLRRASTDEGGIAKMEVTKGKHELYVSMRDYMPFQTTIEVAGDVTVKAELIFCPVER